MRRASEAKASFETQATQLDTLARQRQRASRQDAEPQGGLATELDELLGAPFGRRRSTEPLRLQQRREAHGVAELLEGEDVSERRGFRELLALQRVHAYVLLGRWEEQDVVRVVNELTAAPGAQGVQQASWSHG